MYIYKGWWGGSGKLTVLGLPDLDSPSHEVIHGLRVHIYSIYILSIGPWMNKPTTTSGVEREKTFKLKGPGLPSR